MDITTLLIIVVVILLLGGGGWYGRGRWYGSATEKKLPASEGATSGQDTTRPRP